MLHAAAMFVGLVVLWIASTQRVSSPQDWAIALGASLVCVLIAMRFGGATSAFARAPQLLTLSIARAGAVTRGALTTFSIANDVAKYFAILPAMFGLLYATTAGGHGPLQALNIMGLHSPQSAILSAVIFNALIIVALIPLALRGVKYTPLGAAVILRKNMFLYGVGGLVVPFIFIKLLDVLLVALRLV